MLGLGLPVIGTLGVLERADLAGFLSDFAGTVAHLESRGLYLSRRLPGAELAVSFHQTGRSIPVALPPDKKQLPPQVLLGIQLP